MPTKKQQDLVADIIERETYRADKTSTSFENQIKFQKNLAPLQAGALLPDLFSSIMTSNGGPARENRFAVKIITPRKLQKEGYISKGFDFETLSLLCDECELPETMVNVISYKDASQSRKTVSGYKNKDISFSFVLTQNYFIKKLFEIWRSFIFDKKTYRANYKDDYTTDIFIAQLDSSNRPIYGVFLKRAFPVKIDDINLTAKNKNTQVNLEVKLAYDDFEEILIGEPSSDIDPSIFTMKNFDNILSSGQEDTSLSDIIYDNKKSQEIDEDIFSPNNKKNIPNKNINIPKDLENELNPVKQKYSDQRIENNILDRDNKIINSYTNDSFFSNLSEQPAIVPEFIGQHNDIFVGYIDSNSIGSKDNDIFSIINTEIKRHEINLDFFQDLLFTQISRIGEKYTNTPFDELTNGLKKVPIVGDVLPDVLGTDVIRAGVTNSINNIFFSKTNNFFENGNNILNGSGNYDDLFTISSKSSSFKTSEGAIRDDFFAISNNRLKL